MVERQDYVHILKRPEFVNLVLKRMVEEAQLRRIKRTSGIRTLGFPETDTTPEQETFERMGDKN